MHHYPDDFFHQRQVGAKDREIETLRGMACVLLVAFHVIGTAEFTGLRLDSSSPWVFVNDLLAYVRMPLFTFLSGFVYAGRPCRGPIIEFVSGKARRLLIPMLVVGTCFAIVQNLVPGLDYDSKPWFLWHVYPVAHFWFLEALFLVVVVMAGLDMFRLLESVVVCLSLLAALTIANAVVPTYQDSVLFAWRNAIYLAPFFLAGLVARRFDWRHGAGWIKGLSAAVLAALACYLVWSAATGSALPATTSWIGVTVGVTGCLMLLTLGLNWRPLTAIGGYSFSIFLFHVFALAATREVLRRAGIESTVVHVVVGVAFGLIVPILIERICKRHSLGRVLVLGERSLRKRSGIVTTAASPEADVPAGVIR